MNTTRTISVGAPDGQPFTLAGLREFIAACEKAEIDDSAVISARITMGGKVKALTAQRQAAPVQ